MPFILRKHPASRYLEASPSGVTAGNRLGNTLTCQAPVFGSVKVSSACGVMLSLPGQNGHELKKEGLSGFGTWCAKSEGRFFLSVAMMTHSLVVGSCLISDKYTSLSYLTANAKLVYLQYILATLAIIAQTIKKFLTIIFCLERDV
jgi:hypothetical protein